MSNFSALAAYDDVAPVAVAAMRPIGLRAPKSSPSLGLSFVDTPGFSRGETKLLRSRSRKSRFAARADRRPPPTTGLHKLIQ